MSIRVEQINRESFLLVTNGRLNELCDAGVDSEGFHFDQGKNTGVCICVCIQLLTNTFSITISSQTSQSLFSKFIWNKGTGASSFH